MSYMPEVQTDSTGKWYSNALRFATYQEAYDNARDLSFRWFAVRDYRATESLEPANYRYNMETRKLEGLKAMKNQIEVIPVGTTRYGSARLYVETIDSKPSHLVFYSLLDAFAIVLGVILGGLAWGYSMACFLFG